MLRIHSVAIQCCKMVGAIADEVARRDGDRANQLRRAMASVALNISEASGSQGKNRNARYFNALGAYSPSDRPFGRALWRSMHRGTLRERAVEHNLGVDAALPGARRRGSKTHFQHKFAQRTHVSLAALCAAPRLTVLSAQPNTSHSCPCADARGAASGGALGGALA